MKTRYLFISLGAISFFHISAILAADTTVSPPNAEQQPTVSVATQAAPSTIAVSASTGERAPARLPYGVEDVLKLSHAQVNEEIILTYIQNSGTTYSLDPKDIIFLRDQGVSDRIVNTMLDQRRKMAETAVQTAPAPTAPAAPIYQDNDVAPTYVQPQAEVQPAPSSSVYVIPYPQATSAYYYGGYDYYRPYYGYYGPSVGFYGPGLSLGFRFGGGRGHFGHFGHRR